VLSSRLPFELSPEANRREGEASICSPSVGHSRCGLLGLLAWHSTADSDHNEEEQEAVQRAREHAEDQELKYEASKHLLESLEVAEKKRSSHLGHCLAAPVTERFLALTDDLYTHVNLDPDLRLEGFVAAGGEHRVEELSVGTREQLATIVRLAAAQLKTAVLLDDQLVHSDSGRIEWFRKQVRNRVREHNHQVIVMTCRLSDYALDDEILGRKGNLSTKGPSLTIINILDVVRRVRASLPFVPS
jgi:hypothetical protein